MSQTQAMRTRMKQAHRLLTLESHEVNTITNGLRVAAERFAEHAKSWTEQAAYAEQLEKAGKDNQGPNSTGSKRLAEQFQMQQRDSLELLELIERAESVQLHNVEADE
jgi:hypothetical protein